MSKKEKELQKKCDVAIKDFYNQWGVGNTYKQKRAFWNSLEPNTNIFHAKTDKQWVAVCEVCWLSKKFPEDFPLC